MKGTGLVGLPVALLPSFFSFAFFFFLILFFRGLALLFYVQETFQSFLIPN